MAGAKYDVHSLAAVNGAGEGEDKTTDHRGWLKAPSLKVDKI